MQQESLTVYFKSVIKKMFIVLVYVIKGNLYMFLKAVIISYRRLGTQQLSV